LKKRKNHQLLEWKKENEEEISCQIHSKRVVGYCVGCDEMICFDCLMKHEKHEIKNIFEIKIKIEDEFEKLSQEVKVMKKKEWTNELVSSKNLMEKKNNLKKIKNEIKILSKEEETLNEFQMEMIGECQLKFNNEIEKEETTLMSNIKIPLELNFFDEFKNQYFVPWNEIKIEIKVVTGGEMTEEMEMNDIMDSLEAKSKGGQNVEVKRLKEKFEIFFEKEGNYWMEIYLKEKKIKEKKIKIILPEFNFENELTNDIQPGIFHFLRNKIEITCSSNKYGEVMDLINFEIEDHEFYTNDAESSWIQFSLKKTGFQLNPKVYSIQHGYHFGDFILRNWKLEGSLNGIEWKLLKEHSNDQQLVNEGYSTSHWNLNPQSEYFSFFKITQTGRNSYGTNHLFIGKIELFGKLKI
jgi:hypothetical protein